MNRSFKKIYILVSLIFTILIGLGFYGYGYDWYEAYSRPNLEWGLWYRDRLGWYITTLTINDFHYGIYLTTFLITISTGTLLEYFFFLKKFKSKLFFLLLFVVIIHTWPIIMSTSNAMRQGLAMSFIFLFFSAIMNEKKKIAFLYILIATFVHTSGPIFFILYISILFLMYLKKIFKKDYNLFIIYLLYSVLLCFIIDYILNINFLKESESLIIGLDFRLPLLIINVIIISYCSFYYKKVLINNPIAIFLMIYSFISITFFINGLNWKFERLGMVMIIPYILFLGVNIKKKHCAMYWLLIFGFLAFLTIQTGMYNSLH